MNKVQTNPNDQWLVKSANRVMGPFKLVEVVTGLHLKHFTVMDEISSPFGRWILIRDEVTLQGAVKEIRNRADINESTMTQTMTQTMTKSITKTMPENTDPVHGGREAPPPMPGSLDPKLIRDTKLLQSLKKKKSNNGWIAAAIVLFGLGGAGYYFGVKRAKNPALDQIAQVLKLKEYGFYDRAFNQMIKLKTTITDDEILDLNIGVFQIALQNQNTAGRKTIEKILGSLDTPKDLAQAHTAIGLSYMQEGDLKNAIVALNKALASDPTFVSAHLNQSVLDYRAGAADKAEQDLEPIITQTDNGLVVLASTLASLEVNRKGMMPMRILPVLLQMLNDYLKNNFAYQQEAYVLKAFIYTSLGKTQQRQDSVLELLNSDLESGENSSYDLLVDRSIFSWKNLVPFCQGIYEIAPSDLMSRSLLAFCFAKAGNTAEAKKIILEAEMAGPKHPYVASIKAYIMGLLGQDGIAKASLSLAGTQKEILSAKLALARFCEKEKNESCVKQHYMDLINTNPRSLPAYVGLAGYEMRLGHKKEALDWVTRGQALSSTYVPLWDLKLLLN